MTSGYDAYLNDLVVMHCPRLPRGDPFFRDLVLTCHFEQSEKSPHEISHYVRDDM